MNFAIPDKWEDKDGRLLLINIQIDDTILTLVCIYAPNCKTARNAFFKKVSSIVKEYGTGIPILGGGTSMPQFFTTKRFVRTESCG